MSQAIKIAKSFNHINKKEEFIIILQVKKSSAFKKPSFFYIPYELHELAVHKSNFKLMLKKIKVKTKI